MAVKHVVTFGFGFASGTVYIPTLGFSMSLPATGEVPLTLFSRSPDFTLDMRSGAFTVAARLLGLTLPER